MTNGWLVLSLLIGIGICIGMQIGPIEIRCMGPQAGRALFVTQAMRQDDVLASIPMNLTLQVDNTDWQVSNRETSLF